MPDEERSFCHTLPVGAYLLRRIIPPQSPDEPTHLSINWYPTAPICMNEVELELEAGLVDTLIGIPGLGSSPYTGPIGCRVNELG
ncbi:MAG TPA: hypothetical protein VN821_01435 [Candidatus Udaeobacter sp.]|nr:hypothetical protein [Candidatus Udaeobacter sp.]